MKILLTAFDPFGGEKINPAQEAVAHVADKVGEAEIIKIVVPTVFATSGEVVCRAIDEYKPDAVLCIGQAGGRPEMTPERVAINIDDARIPDNAGGAPVDAKVKEDGDPAYFATLPIKKMVEAIHAIGIPASVSNTAGTYVCNHLMYCVLYHEQRHYPGMLGGFMHVPFVPEQIVSQNSHAPSMSRRDITAAIEAALGAIAEECR